MLNCEKSELNKLTMDETSLLRLKKMESVYGFIKLVRILLVSFLLIGTYIISKIQEHSMSKTVITLNYITVSIH